MIDYGLQDRVALITGERETIPFTQENGEVRYTVERLECHQMVVLDY